MLILACMMNYGVKKKVVTKPKIAVFLITGIVLFFGNAPLLSLQHTPDTIRTGLYSLALIGGYCCLMAGLLWILRLIKKDLLEDPFNEENESFMQEMRLKTNEHSVNLPTRFRYKGKLHTGWINVVNPFRATIVLGTPGSGKSYAVINNYIKQSIEHGSAIYLYDFKFPDLSLIAYNHLRTHLDGYTV